jgi:hypothetical protein
MSAPIGMDHAAQWSAWQTTWAYLLAPDDVAGSARLLGAGVQLQTHEDHVSALQERDVAFEEDSRHVPTSTANRF